MNDLLYLVHRIPYPPNKGDKIRSFNTLKHLAKHFRVHLGSFVDDPDDWRHQDAVAPYCESLFLLPLHPRRARIRSLSGLLTGAPLTVPYYRDRRMADWARGILGNGTTHALAFSSAMAQYLPEAQNPGLRTVVDFVDVDSDKWRQYAEGHRFPMNWVYRREARTLLAFERHMAAQHHESVFVSEQEAALFRKLAPESATRVHGIDMGVDTEYFSPEREYPNPFPPATRNLVFTGAMDYWANVDAVTFFAEEVFPKVVKEIPEARFVIVGARPSPEVKRLAERPGITVTGAVKDVRPFLAHCALAVAPLRIARGVQSKVLEALAMSRPVVATPQALEGLRERAGAEWMVGTTASELAELTLRALSETAAAEAGTRGRAYVCNQYRWTDHLDRLVGLLKGSTTSPFLTTPERNGSPG